jgi:hypothetical protein
MLRTILATPIEKIIKHRQAFRNQKRCGLGGGNCTNDCDSSTADFGNTPPEITRICSRTSCISDGVWENTFLDETPLEGDSHDGI